MIGNVSAATSLAAPNRTRAQALRLVFYAAILSVLIGPGAFGQSTTPAADTTPELFDEPNWQAVCAKALAAPLPPAAAALAAAAKSAPAMQCDQQALYYGLGNPPNYAAALQCAYRNRAHPANEFMNGAGTLTMLYANGDGVPRNYPLAIRFACEVDFSAPAETQQRVGRLEAMQAGKLPATTRFDLCDDQTSGAMGSYCSGLTEKQADAVRARRVAAAAKRLPRPAQAMLPQLQAAETAFEEARIHGEYDGGGGSANSSFLIDDRNRLREQFVTNLERFAAGKLPHATAAERQQAEQVLATAYQAVQAIPRSPGPSPMTPTPEGYKATEEAWQALFQKWMQFVPIAYPQLSPDAAATELLKLRIHQLKKIAG